MRLTHEIFDKIYCINLERRQDRRDQVVSEFAKHNIQGVQIFTAFDGKFINPMPGINGGNTGCILSHLAIIRSAKEQGLRSVLIFEDDVEFSEDYNAKIQFVPEQYGVLYFGGSDVYEKATRLDENFCHIVNSLCTHAYALQAHMFDTFIDILTPGPIGAPIDVLYSALSEKIPFIGFRPKIAWQRESHSDILNKKVRYVSTTNEPNPKNQW